jgi:hypothetical protein
MEKLAREGFSRMTKVEWVQVPESGFGGITFLHTAPGHVATFGTLMTSLAPEIPVRHEVAEPLLAAARHSGQVPAEVAERARQVIRDLSNNGARVVVCTCTTLGASVDQQADSIPATVASGVTLGAGVFNTILQRIDRAAIVEACRLTEGPLTIAACLEASLQPTLDLIARVSAEMGKPVTVAPILIPDAWALFESGLRRAYLEAIAQRIRKERPDGGVILLNQPSMAGAERLLENPPYTVISSPMTGVRAAIEAWRTASGLTASMGTRLD